MFYIEILHTMSHDLETKVYILHSENAEPEQHWYVWLNQQLQSSNVKVERIFLADATHPDVEVWQTCLEAQMSQLNERSIIVAHGLSSLAVVQFLTVQLQQGAIKAAIFIAAFNEPLPKHPEFNAFIQHSQLGVGILRANIQRRIVMFSSNDPIVPVPFTFKFSNSLNAQLIEVMQAGHFRTEDGYHEFPQLLEIIQSLLKPS